MKDKLFNPKATCFALMALWANAFWPTVAQAGRAYIQSGYDYQGLLVIPILTLLIMRNSANLKRATFAYNPLGLLMLLLCGSIWLFATLVELEVLQQISIVSMIFAIVFTTCGKKVTSIIMLPLTCLFLLLPIGGQINLAVQQTFAWALMQGLMLAKQAVYWESNIIFANNYTYDIHAYLSSMQYVLSFLACGACFAMLRTRTLTLSITIALSFIIMPLAILWLSLFCYILLNQWFTPPNIFANHIIVTGWFFTILGLLHAIFLGVRTGDSKNSITTKDDIDWRHQYIARGQRIVQPLIMASCILLLVPMIGQQFKTSSITSTKVLPAIPNTVASWKSQNNLPANKRLANYFSKDQDTVSLAITAEGQPPEAAWKKIKESSKKIKLMAQSLPIVETVLLNDQNKYKINWTVNYINGYFTTNQTIAKALTGLYNLSAQEVKTGVITVSTDVNSELNTARDRLKNFLQDYTNSDSAKVLS